MVLFGFFCLVFVLSFSIHFSFVFNPQQQQQQQTITNLLPTSKMASNLISLERNNKLFHELTTKFPGCDNLFKWFLALNEIPRPSHHTAVCFTFVVHVLTLHSACFRVDNHFDCTLPWIPRQEG